MCTSVRNTYIYIHIYIYMRYIHIYIYTYIHIYIHIYEIRVICLLIHACMPVRSEADKAGVVLVWGGYD